MKIYEESNCIIIENPSDFSLKHTFDCGQCFRFEGKDGVYSGVAFKNFVILKEEENRIIIENLRKEDFDRYWYPFFDFKRDYGEIKKILSNDDIMKKAIEFGKGIRILKQEFFECLISFILSPTLRI